MRPVSTLTLPGEECTANQVCPCSLCGQLRGRYQRCKKNCVCMLCVTTTVPTPLDAWVGILASKTAEDPLARARLQLHALPHLEVGHELLRFLQESRMPQPVAGLVVEYTRPWWFEHAALPRVGVSPLAAAFLHERKCHAEDHTRRLLAQKQRMGVEQECRNGCGFPGCDTGNMAHSAYVSRRFPDKKFREVAIQIDGMPCDWNVVAYQCSKCTDPAANKLEHMCTGCYFKAHPGKLIPHRLRHDRKTVELARPDTSCW